MDFVLNTFDFRGSYGSAVLWKCKMTSRWNSTEVST